MQKLLHHFWYLRVRRHYLLPGQYMIKFERLCRKSRMGYRCHGGARECV